MHTDASVWQQTLAFCPRTVAVCNETKCGQADGQMNETATESLAVFDLPPLIQRDHLINWEDGMYIRIARGASLLFPIPNQITPQPPLEHPEGRMFPLCVCMWERKGGWGLLGGVSFLEVLQKANEGVLVSTFCWQWWATKPPSQTSKGPHHLSAKQSRARALRALLHSFFICRLVRWVGFRWFRLLIWALVGR